MAHTTPPAINLQLAAVDRNNAPPGVCSTTSSSLYSTERFGASCEFCHSELQLPFFLLTLSGAEDIILLSERPPLQSQ